MKSRWKRLLASVLAASMLLSMVQIAGFAAGRTGEVALPEVEIANQNTDGATVDGADGTFINGKKTIEKTGDDTFNITLEVTTKSKGAVIVNADAAVTLVIDVSGSMGRCATCDGESTGLLSGNWKHKDNCEYNTGLIFASSVKESESCMYAAKSSAISFLDSLKKDVPEGSKRYVSLVKFSTNASVVQDWVDIMTSDGYNAVKNAINNLSANGGTNLEQGLSKANGLMSAGPDGVAKDNKFTVVLTDGEPTYYGTGPSGNGGSASQETCNQAINAANTLKGNSNEIYSVFFGDASANGCYDAEGNRCTISAFLARMTGNANNTYNATDTTGLNNAFANISKTISDAVDAAGTIVTDPMSAYVTFQNVEMAGYDEATKSLSWDLANAESVSITKDGDFTITTYRLTYPIKVERTAAFYDAVKADGSVPTNGKTTMPYTLGDTKGTLEFIVPTVKSEIPTVNYTIEYYKQNRDGTGYTQDTNATKTGTGEYGTRVTLSEQDAGYATKYASENYTHAKTDNATLTIGLDASKNVIKVYYDRKTTSAVVNYHYKLTTIFENGQKFVDTDDVYGTPVDGLFVGDAFSVTAPETSTYGGYIYGFVKAEPSATIDSLKEDDAQNVIDLYYELTIDQRADASVVVDHVYTLHTYELENGKYVAKDVVTEVPNVESGTGLKAGMTYTASYYPTHVYGSYGFMGIVGRDNVKTLAGGENKIILYFEDWEDPRGEEMSLTVNHHYTKSVTTIDANGNVVTTVDPDNVVGHTDTIKFYAGETVTVDKQRVYNGDTYEIGGASDTVTLPNPMDGAEYGLFYTLTEVPEKTTVTVKHIYQTVTHETVYTINPDTKVITGTEVKDVVVTDDTKTVTDSNVYKNQSYTAPVVGRDGYQCQTDENVRTAIVAADGTTVINVYYLKDGGKIDNRDAATIDVQHVYTTHVTAIVGGVEKTFDIVTSEPDQATTGKVGDKFQAQTKLTDAVGNIYTLVGNEPAEVVLHAGTNSTIVINYERDDNQLVNTSYEVNYKYYTRTMTVENGVAVWGEPVLDTETTKTPTGGTGYVGQKVELDTGAKDGYYAMEGNPSATQFLGKTGNVWTFQYVKDVPLDRVPVTVNHHITTRTLTIDGETSFTQHAMGRPEYKYKGELYEAKALDATLILVNVNGNDVDTTKTVTFDALTGTVVVDFYYEIVNDYRVPATYTVQHIYRTIDWDGKVTIDNPNDVPTETKTYAFMTRTAYVSLPENGGYELKQATYNGKDVTVDENGTYSFTVQNGENAVVFVYERTVDTRPTTSVKVIHKYYASANAETPAFTDEENFTEDLRVPSNFTATAKPTKNNVAYTRTTGDGELTITLVEDAEKNVITIKYVRAETSYTVVHEYYTNGNLTGSSEVMTVAGKAGDVITADSIAKVTSYNGNTYTYTSTTGAPLTLVQGENGTITLRYDRTTTPDRPTPIYYYTLTINYVDESGNVVATQYTSGRQVSGWNYSVTSPEVEGMTPDQETVSGILTRNTTITVVYTAVENVDDNQTPTTETPEPTESTEPTETQEPEETEDLEETDTPLAEKPDVEPEETQEPDETEELEENGTPLAEVPQTGDSLGLWIVLALCSAAGLAWIALTEKKGKRVA